MLRPFRLRRLGSPINGRLLLPGNARPASRSVTPLSGSAAVQRRAAKNWKHKVLPIAIRQKDRPGARRLLFGPQVRVDICGMSRARGSLAAQHDLCLGTVDAWLIANLTGHARHVTDATNASRTMLYDIHTHAWDDDLLALFGIPREALPRVVPSSGVIENTDPAVFGAAVPIAGIAGDQQAALFGQTCWQPGHAKNTYGTGCFLLSHTGAQATASHAGLLINGGSFCRKAQPMHLEGSVFVAGAAVQWLRDKLGVIATAAESETLARQVPDSGGVVVVPAFTGSGHALLGPTGAGYHSRLDSGLDQSARRSRYLGSNSLSNARRSSTRCSRSQALRCKNSGRTAARWQTPSLCRPKPIILGIPVVVPAVAETTALGAAYLAGLGVGFWPDASAVAAQWRVARRYEPQISADERESPLRHLATRRRTRTGLGNRLVASGRYHEEHTPTTAQPVIKIALRRSCCDKVVCKVPSAQRNTLHIRH